MHMNGLLLIIHSIICNLIVQVNLTQAAPSVVLRWKYALHGINTIGGASDSVFLKAGANVVYV